MYAEGHDPYERLAYESPVAPSPLHPPLPPLSAPVLPPPSYAYGRPLEMNAYRRDPLVEQQGGKFLDLELRRRVQIEYRRDPLHERPVRLLLDSEYRRRELLDSGYRRRGEIGQHDPYLLYRDRPLYHDVSHAATQSSEYHPAGPSLHPSALPPEYWPRRPVC